MSKKPKDGASGLPEVEDLIDVPEEVGHVTEPDFRLVLGYLSGHKFLVREASKSSDAHDAHQDADQPPKEFDPCSLLLEYAKSQGDVLAKKIVILEREELQSLLTEANGLQDRPLSAALHLRLKKERAARARLKYNVARKKAIVDFEASKAAETDAPEAAAEQPSEPSVPEVDVVFLLNDVFTSQDELQALSTEGLCTDGVVDLWTSIYFAGETIDESNAIMTSEPPPFPHFFQQEIQRAALGTDLSNCKVCAVKDSHLLAFAPETDPAAAQSSTPADRVKAAILATLSADVDSRRHFSSWLQGANHLRVPDMQRDEEGKVRAAEDRLYHRLMSEADSTHHNVPFFLHCLTEQVQQTLSGEVKKKEDEEALADLKAYLDQALETSMADGKNVAPKAARRFASDESPEPAPKIAGLSEEAAAHLGPLVPFLDRAASIHRLGSGPRSDAKKILENVHEVLEKVSVPGTNRAGLPRDSFHSASEREAIQNRFYPFAPDVSCLELEQLLTLHAFQELLARVQPERKWCLKDWTFREQIPKEFLSQHLEAALRDEPFVDSVYLPRHDCLLVAMHQRSAPGRVLWHGWHGDLLSSSSDASITMPTFSDWEKVVASRSSDAIKMLPPKFVFDNIDARQLGYNAVVEKLATPADGSLIVVSQMEFGLSPSEDPFTDAEATSKIDVSPKSKRRMARVFKDGLRFGIVDDKSWKKWQEEDRAKRVKAAADALKETAGDGEEARPPSDELQAEEIGYSFPDLELGQFWLSFPYGARLTARMHHESAIQRGAAEGRDLSTSSTLPPTGTLLTYTSAAGQSVQVFSDGSVRLSYPVDSVGLKRSHSSKTARFKPGCAEDIEVMRTITPFGTIIRKLISGRLEVVHPDGTTATRNPTIAELQKQVEAMKPKSTTEALVSRFLKAAQDQQNVIDEKLQEQQKVAGLPGHWVVARPDGHRYGRVAEDVGRDVAEYEIPSIATALQVDLLTKHRALTNSRGFASFEDPEGHQKVCVHYDGTRVTRTAKQFGYDVEFYREPLPLIRCEVRTKNASDFLEEDLENVEVEEKGFRTFVECADGTTLEVRPEVLKQSGCYVPLPPDIEDFGSSATHCTVNLCCREGNIVTTSASGQVELRTAFACKADDVQSYIAYCDESKLVLRDAEGCVYEVNGKQMLSTSSESGAHSPRCQEPQKAYYLANASDLPLPEPAPKPRLFVVYGDGKAEELLTIASATQILEAAKGDPMCTVVGPQSLLEKMPGPMCHTIFKARLPDNIPVPQMGSLALPEGIDGGASVCSVISQASQQASLEAVHQTQVTQAGTITEFRQLIEYPLVTEEAQTKLRGTLKQYQSWEAEEVAKHRANLAVTDGKGKKDGKVEKAKKEKVGKKDKKKGAEQEEKPQEVIEIPPEPTFVQGLKLNAFQHHLKALQLRQDKLALPTAEELLSKALAAYSAGLTNAGQDVTEATASAQPPAEGKVSPLEGDTFEDENYEDGMEPPYEDAVPDHSAITQKAIPPRVRRQHIVETQWSFSYFKSEMGLQFLVDTGELDPERRPLQGKVKQQRSRQPHPNTRRSPWNPRLVGEPEDDITDVPEDDAQAEVEDEVLWAGRTASGFNNGFVPPAGGNEFQPVPEEADRSYFSPGTRLPMVPEKDEAPVGPHPNKKGPGWDVYGEARGPKAKVSQAYIAINTDYLQVEGATDRRVRTAAVANKKNSAKAPSVSSVRKTGQHAIGRGTEVGAKDILGEEGLQVHEEHWKLSSTMQGLGDSNKLVEVVPGACRFGPLRLGSLYRMAFFIRNLDVDVTRFTVTPLKSDFVRVIYQPGHLAPGIATKILVEVMAIAPARIEQLVEIKVKAHVVRVPVTARVFDAEEYDRLDAESLALHGRRIGRHRERGDNNKPSPVELISDPAYCRKVLKDAYLPPPPDFEDVPEEDFMY